MSINKLDFMELNQYALKFRQLRDKWLLHIFQASALLFGVLISLYKLPLANSCQLGALLYLSSVSLLAFGILASGIALFSQVAIANQQFRDLKAMKLSDQDIVAGREPKIFAFVRAFAYICFSFSLLGFVAYLWFNLVAGVGIEPTTYG